MVAVYVVLGAALWLTGAATRGGRFSGMHELWGILLVCGGLYVLGFFRHGWGWRHEEGAPWLAVWPLLSWAVIAGWVAWRRRREELGWVPVMLGLGLVSALAVAGHLWLGDDGWFWSAWAWASLFGLNLAMVHTGLREGREGLVNLAV